MSVYLFESGFSYYIGVALKWLAIIALLLIVCYGILVFTGRDLNWGLFVHQSDQCFIEVQSCHKDLLYGGIEGHQCNFECIDPTKIIVPHESVEPLF